MVLLSLQRRKASLIKGIVLGIVLLFQSCVNNNLADTTTDIPDHNWLYANSAKAEVIVKDSSKHYQIVFKIRNSEDYRYSNLFVILRIKSDQRVISQSRVQVQLADHEGRWLGKGSGNLYSSEFPVIKHFKFPHSGKYSIEVEQNMRDNPLAGVSDVGLRISPLEN